MNEILATFNGDFSLSNRLKSAKEKGLTEQDILESRKLVEHDYRRKEHQVDKEPRAILSDAIKRMQVTIDSIDRAPRGKRLDWSLTDLGNNIVAMNHALADYAEIRGYSDPQILEITGLSEHDRDLYKQRTQCDF